MTNPRFLDSKKLSAARELFPHTRTGKIYLNHASTSPLSTPVIDAINRHYEARSVGAIDTYSRDSEEVRECRKRARQLVNAESPDRIALIANTSDSLNIVASGMTWKSGDRVLLNESEFPANVYPYMALKRHGVELDVLPTPHGKISPAMIEQNITSRTRLVALSAVQFLSGFRADLGSIGDLCRRRGIVFAVDGIQAVGAVRIDVQQMKIDALGAGAQKWLIGPHGIGFLYLTEALQQSLQQQFVGWLSVNDPWNFHNYKQPLASSARRYEGGSLNFPGVWGLNASLKVLLEVGPEEIENHVLALTDLLTKRFQSLREFRLSSPENTSERAGIVTIQPTDTDKGHALFKRLMEKDITIAVREGKLRFSPHFYNTSEELERTVEVLS